jgi:hypothetical protein
MKNQLIGVALATVAVYMWGFAYWGATTIPYGPLKASANDPAVQAALLEHFPETGAYLVPGMHNPAEVLTPLYEAGPIAFVFIQRDGHPMEDPALMFRGFLLTIVIVFLFSVLMKKALPALPTYGNRVMFAALVGLTAVVMVDFGDAVWWRFDWSWKLAQAFYGLMAATIGGAVLAKFIKPAKVS